MALRTFLSTERHRHSTVHVRARLHPTESNAHVDVLWFRVSRKNSDQLPLLSLGPGFTVVTLDRGTYWQVAYLIPKGKYAHLRTQPTSAIADHMRPALPTLSHRFAQEISSWDDIKLLNVTVNHLKRWHHPSLICIGDAAHAMAPVAGVGINLAIQDAVAAARILGPDLAAGKVPKDSLLAQVQRRRQLPARIIQLGQVKILTDLYAKNLDNAGTMPAVAKLVPRSRLLQKTAARIIGLGLRPEHI